MIRDLLLLGPVFICFGPWDGCSARTPAEVSLLGCSMFGFCVFILVFSFRLGFPSPECLMLACLVRVDHRIVD